MNWKKTLALVSAGLASAASHASFEMLLVLDGTTKSVHRFDPQSGAYLGNFGAGWLNNPQNITIDQSTGTAYVWETEAITSTSKVVAFNYNTGERTGGGFLTGYFSDPVQAFRRANGEFLVAGQALCMRLSVAGYASTTYSATGMQGGVAEGTDGQVYLANYTTKRVERFSLAGALLATSSATSFVGEGQMTRYGGRMYFATSASNVFSIDQGFANGGGSWRQLNTANVGTTRGLAFGHGGLMYIAGMNAGGTAGIVQRWDADLSQFGGTFGESVLKNPIGCAAVVAPEPGTLAACALGLAALARRRKKR